MFTRPEDLTDAEVAAALIWGWGLDVEAVEYAPVGFGSHHWWVRTADGAWWFATADDLRTRRLHDDEPVADAVARLRSAHTTAAALHEAGLTWVVAPVRATDGSVVRPLGDHHVLALHPRVVGRTFGWGPYEDDAHREAVLDRLVDLHTVSGCRADVGVDDLAVRGSDELRAVVEDPGPQWDAGPFGGEAWRLVRRHGDVARRLLEQHADLLRDADPARFVITHGEPHRANTLDTDAGVVLVDWDTVLLGPPERDLWRIVGEDPAVAVTYAQRTGTALDPGLLEAYRVGWDLADVASFVPVLRHAHVDDEDTRTAFAGLRAVLEGDG